MATGLYDLGRESFLKGEISWSGDEIRVALVNNTYTQNLATDQFFSDISAVVVGTPQTITTGKTTTAGVADGQDVTFPTVATGSTCEAVVIYQWTGVTTTSRLIAYIDNTSATGLPVVTNDGDISVTWANTADRIFKL